MKSQEPKHQSPLPFATKVEHLRHSLDNVQATIRLLDAKVAGVIAFVTLLIGFAVSKSSLLSQLKTFDHPWLLWPLFILLILSFFAVLLFALLTQIPRRSEKIKDRLWLLFPLKPDDLGETYLRDKISNFEFKDVDNDGKLELVTTQNILYSLEDSTQTIGKVEITFSIEDKKLTFKSVEVKI